MGHLVDVGKARVNFGSVWKIFNLARILHKEHDKEYKYLM